MKEYKIIINLVIVLCLFCLTYLCLLGNNTERYSDLILEWTSGIESNKSIEKNLYYYLCLVGCLYALIFHLKKRKSHLDFIDDKFQIFDNPISLFAIFFALIILIRNQVNLPIGAMLVVCLCIKAFKKDKSELWISYILSVFIIIGFYSIYAIKHGKLHLSYVAIYIIASIFVFGLSFLSNKKIRRFNLISQVFIPASILVCVASDYMYHGEIIKLREPFVFRITVYCILGLLVINGIYSLVKNWKNPGICNYLTIGTFATIFFFLDKRYIGGLIIYQDLHHPVENMLGYSQSFELGQALFSEYIPISGMYSVLEGWFHAFEGNSVLSTVQSVHQLYELILIILLAWTLSLHKIDRSVILLICLFATVVNYNRSLFVLPIMLLLSAPCLIERSGLWLKVWILSSLFNGLYYPLYGAAVCIAFAPLGLIVFKQYIDGFTIKTLKQPLFYIGWMITLFPILLSLPWLYGSFIHMVAMANQTLHEAGISRFGQYLPGWFFNYAGKLIRYPLMYAFTFVVPSLIVIFSFIYFIRNLKSKILWSLDNKIAYLMIAPAIMLLICFTYTTIRLDVYALYNRNSQAMIAALVCLVIFAITYYRVKSLFRSLVLLFSVVMVSGYFDCFSNLEGEINFTKYIGDDWILIDEKSGDPIDKKLGRAFIHKDTYGWIQNTRHLAEDIVKDQDSFSVLAPFGLYYIFDKPGVATIEHGTIKGKGAVEEAAKILVKTQALTASPDPYVYYYLYKWLVTSGNYIWDPENNLFRFNTEHKDVFGVNNNISNRPPIVGYGRDPSSFGSSYDSLRKIFSDVSLHPIVDGSNPNEIVINIDPVMGEKMDYLYLEFEDPEPTFKYQLYDMVHNEVFDTKSLTRVFYKKYYNPGKRINVSYDVAGDERDFAMSCEFSRGKLLIPLGSGYRWLLNEHSKLKISMTKDGQQFAVPPLKKMDFLLLRSVEI